MKNFVILFSDFIAIEKKKANKTKSNWLNEWIDDLKSKGSFKSDNTHKNKQTKKEREKTNLYIKPKY